jgi:hypothetical protein
VRGVHRHSPVPYAHGYISGTKWRDIMSDPESCAGCPRTPFWSDAWIIYKGESTGTLSEDYARVIGTGGARVALPMEPRIQYRLAFTDANAKLRS